MSKLQRPSWHEAPAEQHIPEDPNEHKEKRSLSQYTLHYLPLNPEINCVIFPGPSCSEFFEIMYRSPEARILCIEKDPSVFQEIHNKLAEENGAILSYGEAHDILRHGYEPRRPNTVAVDGFITYAHLDWLGKFSAEAYNTFLILLQTNLEFSQGSRKTFYVSVTHVPFARGKAMSNQDEIDYVDSCLRFAYEEGYTTYKSSSEVQKYAAILHREMRALGLTYNLSIPLNHGYRYENGRPTRCRFTFKIELNTNDLAWNLQDVVSECKEEVWET